MLFPVAVVHETRIPPDVSGILMLAGALLILIGSYRLSAVFLLAGGLMKLAQWAG